MITNHKLFIVLGGIPGTLNSGVREGLVRGPFIKRNRSLFHCYTPVNKHSNGKPPFSIGVTSSKGGFPIAMLVYRSVVGGGYTPNIVPIKITSSQTRHVFFHFSSPLEDSQRSWTEAGKSSASWPLNKPWGFNVRGKETISAIHPWKLTCPQKRDYFSREYIFQTLMFGGHVSFQGSKLFIQTKWVVGRVAFDVFFFRVGKKKDQFLFLVGEDISYNY